MWTSWGGVCGLAGVRACGLGGVGGGVWTRCVCGLARLMLVGMVIFCLVLG